MVRRYCLLVAVTLAAGCGRPAPDRIVLYCAQDRPFAESALKGFTLESGQTVSPKFDSEANKSVGLFRELQMEAERPRCDVHWNNEILTTLMLSQQGILEPYASPAAADYPAFARAADHTWTAFAARARVLLVNTERTKELPRSLLDLTDPKWQGKLAMSKPTHGTSATQAACLFEVMGAEHATKFYRGLRANDVQVLPGNKQVAEAVGHGDMAIGWTDTDDAMEEVQAGRPVAVVFPDADGGTDAFPRFGTLFIPNTVAVIKGGPNPAGARKLVDYLLSSESERRLALAGGYQIPLNPKVEVDLPAALQPARKAVPMQVDFAKAAALWEKAQAVMRDEFAR